MAAYAETVLTRAGVDPSARGEVLAVEEFARILPGLKCQHIVLGHVSRRTGIRRAKAILRKLVGDEEMKRIYFLMDFEGSRDAGDADALLPEGGE